VVAIASDDLYSRRCVIESRQHVARRWVRSIRSTSTRIHAPA